MFTLLYLLLAFSSFCLPLCFAFCVALAMLPLFRFSLPGVDLFDLPFDGRLGFLPPVASAAMPVPPQWRSVVMLAGAVLPLPWRAGSLARAMAVPRRRDFDTRSAPSRRTSPSWFAAKACAEDDESGSNPCEENACIRCHASVSSDADKR